MNDQTSSPAVDTAAMNDGQLESWIESTGLEAPSTASFKGSTATQNALGNAAATMTLAGLPPFLREPIEEKLKDVPHARYKDEEHRLIQGALREHSYNYRAKTGVGGDANPYQRERYAIAVEATDLEEKIKWARAELDEVIGYDQSTGAPIMKAQGPRRKALAEEITRLSYSFGQLMGPERDHRLAKAKQEAVTFYREAEAKRAEAAEVSRRTDELIRERRIQKKAEALAGWKDSEL